MAAELYWSEWRHRARLKRRVSRAPRRVKRTSSPSAHGPSVSLMVTLSLLNPLRDSGVKMIGWAPNPRMSDTNWVMLTAIDSGPAIFISSGMLSVSPRVPQGSNLARLTVAELYCDKDALATRNFRPGSVERLAVQSSSHNGSRGCAVRSEIGCR